MGKWSRPLGTLTLVICLGALVILVTIVLPITLYYGDWDLGDIAAFLIFSVSITMIPTMIMYILTGEVSNFAHKRYDEPIDKILPRLEEVLAAREVPFANRRGPKRTTMRIRVDEYLDLNQGQVTIALAPEDEATRVFLGPVIRDNQVVIERLKGLVDEALG